MKTGPRGPDLAPLVRAAHEAWRRGQLHLSEEAAVLADALEDHGYLPIAERLRRYRTPAVWSGGLHPLLVRVTDAIARGTEPSLRLKEHLGSGFYLITKADAQRLAALAGHKLRHAYEYEVFSKGAPDTFLITQTGHEGRYVWAAWAPSNMPKAQRYLSDLLRTQRRL